MNLQDKINSEHSKEVCAEIIQWIGDNQKRFDELFKIFTGPDKKLSQRAGWPMSYAAMAHPPFMKKHIGTLLENLKNENLHDAIKRNSVRLLQAVPIPKKHLGTALTICFDYIQSPTEKPAIKAFSLTIIENISKEYPDIKPELKTIIEDRWDYESAAFKSRAKKILRSL